MIFPMLFYWGLTIYIVLGPFRGPLFSSFKLQSMQSWLLFCSTLVVPFSSELFWYNSLLSVQSWFFSGLFVLASRFGLFLIYPFLPLQSWLLFWFKWFYDSVLGSSGLSFLLIYSCLFFWSTVCWLFWFKISFPYNLASFLAYVAGVQLWSLPGLGTAFFSVQNFPFFSVF